MDSVYTVNDYVNMNPNIKKAWDPKTNTATLTNTANGKSISWAANNGAQYGLGSDENAAGSHQILDISKLNSALNGVTPTQNVPASTGYSSPYKGNIAYIVNQLATRQGFNYNPNTDAGFQNASKQVQKQALETANARGIVNSSVASGEASQAAANLLPQYEQLAYTRYNDETQNMLNKLNVLNQLDSQSYQQYQDQIQNDFEQQKIDIQKNQQEIDKEQNKITNAWKSVQSLGYVDNEASIALGVPVGTPSWEAKDAADQRAYELDKMKQEYQLKDQQLDKQHAQDIEIIGLKNQYDVENAATQHGYNMEENQQKGDIDLRNNSAIEGQRAANSIALENIRSANDVNLANINAANNKEIAQMKLSNSQSSEYNQTKNLQSYISTINKMFISKDQDTGGYVVNDTDALRKYIIMLGLSDDDTDRLLSQYGLPINNNVSNESVNSEYSEDGSDNLTKYGGGR